MFLITIDSDKTNEVDARILTGDWTGRIVKGLGELKGDSFRLCLADHPDHKRPEKVDPKAGGQFFVLKRVPPSGDAIVR
jgi:hypothetical protein